MPDMGTLTSTTNYKGYAVNGVLIGEPFAGSVDDDGNVVEPYAWDWPGPDGEIIDGEVIAQDEDGQPYTAAVLVTGEAHALALADAAAAEAAAVAAAEAAAAEREANIDKVPVIEQAVDELIVAVLQP